MTPFEAWWSSLIEYRQPGKGMSLLTETEMRVALQAYEVVTEEDQGLVSKWLKGAGCNPEPSRGGAASSNLAQLISNKKEQI